MPELLISVRPAETRVAYVENGEATDVMVEKTRQKGLVGSIYRGQVIRVLPGMQAAFVDIGLDRAAFLYVGDVRKEVGVEESLKLFEEDEESSTKDKAAGRMDEPLEPRIPIQDLLKEGQTILVQVAKDPLGTKGARITTHISLPGRHVVYMPTLKHVGVSRRIESEEERERLKAIVEKVRPSKGGFICRTAAEGATSENIRSDVDYLVLLSKEIFDSYERKKTIGLIHSELDVELRAVRDLVYEEISQVLIDDEKTYKKVRTFASQFMPQLKDKIALYTEEKPLFDLYNIDLEISRALERKVWLKSGGYIVIDEAEALVVIDVNTGKYVGKKDLEETILKTNLEAVQEIAHQLRIRNIGGIIIIDFIDMEKEAHREKVLNLLRGELAKDRARTNVMGMSPLGLVEMTRKRIRPSLVKTLCEPCSYCEGRGYTKHKQTVANEVFRELEKEGPYLGSGSTIVHCHADVADWVYDQGNEMLEFLEQRLNRKVVFKIEPDFHIEQYEIYGA